MSGQILQTQSELEEHLSDQIRFLESSADSFDAGFTGEAKRMAIALRVLLHDTSKSHSLLGQLGRKNILFYDTAFPFNPQNKLSHSGLTAVRLSGSDAKHIPFLDDVPHGNARQVEFSVWWNAPVFVDADKRVLTRKDLVLYVADKDGGAHIDPALDEIYARLSRHNSLDWWYTYDGVNTPAKEPERASIRQIAHEVLKTLKVDYSKNMTVPSEGLVITQPGMEPALVPQSSVQKVGRNKPCPCGSGKKYKHCHGKTR